MTPLELRNTIIAASLRPATSNTIRCSRLAGRSGAVRSSAPATIGQPSRPRWDHGASVRPSGFGRRAMAAQAPYAETFLGTSRVAEVAPIRTLRKDGFIDGREATLVRIPSYAACQLSRVAAENAGK